MPVAEIGFSQTISKLITYLSTLPWNKKGLRVRGGNFYS